MQCPNCGGTIIGDGYTSVLHCEYVDKSSYEYHEPDASPVYCSEDCLDCIVEEMPSEVFTQIIDIHNDSIYVLNKDYMRNPYDFVDGTTMEIRDVIAPVCPRCKVQPANEQVFVCDKCKEEM
jgi:ribosomal protein L37AE/L43A